MPPLTKYELYYSNEIMNDPEELMDFDDDGEPPIDWVTKKKGKKAAKKS
jgi:hypothetical protein